MQKDLTELLKELLKGDLTDSEIENLQVLLNTDNTRGSKFINASHGAISIGGGVGGNVYIGVENTTSERLSGGDVDNFCRAIIAHHSKLRFGDSDSEYVDNPMYSRLSLTSVYVNPYIQGPIQTYPTRVYKNLRLRTNLPKPPTVIRALSENPYLFLFGSAGSGKSTLIDFIATCLAGEKLNIGQSIDVKRLGKDWKLPWLLPLPISLRHFGSWMLRESIEWHDQIFFEFVSLLVGYNSKTSLFQHFIKDFLSVLQTEGGLLLLDGLDEVVGTQFSVTKLRDALRALTVNFPKCRVVITCRPYAYDNALWSPMNFHQASIAPLTASQIDAYVYNWYLTIHQQQGTIDSQTALGRAQNLRRIIRSDETLADLASNPLLLSLLTRIHSRKGGVLPLKREGLFYEGLTLLFDQWERHRQALDDLGNIVLLSPSASEWFRTDSETLLQSFELLAYIVHSRQSSTKEPTSITTQDLYISLSTCIQDDPDLRPSRIIEFASQRTGIIIPQAQNSYIFPHVAFQEYLAARYLSRVDFPNLLVREFQANPTNWFEVALLVGEKVSHGTPYAMWSLVEALYSLSNNAKNSSIYLAALAAAQIVITEKQHISPPVMHVPKLSKIKDLLKLAIRDNAYSTHDLHKAGILLGALGDDRQGVGLDEEGLPHISWISISDNRSGSLGSEDDSFALAGSEIPRQKTNPRFFKISQYPITVIQFESFLKHNDFSLDKIRKYWPVSGFKWLDQDFSSLAMRNIVASHGNHPVTDISWFAATAFCNWLTEVLSEQKKLKKGEIIVLPTEIQWEKAARGSDFRAYPWGNNFSDGQCNSVEMGIGTTCAVGLHTNGNSPYGISDMSGNVWEWCQEAWREQYSMQISPDKESNAARPLKGGCYSSTWQDVRSAVRYWMWPNQKSHEVGFRIVCHEMDEHALQSE